VQRRRDRRVEAAFLGEVADDLQVRGLVRILEEWGDEGIDDAEDEEEGEE